MNQPQINNNALQLFNFKGDAVNVLTDKNGEPWFVTKDVMNVLGLSNTTETLRTLDKDEFSTTELIDKIGRLQQFSIITEGGLYSLIFKSRKPEAREFKRWVTHEVLPQIRKTGGYIPANVDEDPSHIMARAILIAQKTIEDQSRQLREQKPKVLFADALTTSKNSVLVGELAKIIRQNGIQIGTTRLFAWLRAHKYLSSRHGEDWNMPTQKSMELQLFEIKTSSHSAPDGSMFTTRTPKVTGKGQQYFVSKLIQHPELVGDAK